MTLALACRTTPETTVLRVTGGLDSPPFAGAPAITRVELRLRGLDGTERTVASVPLGALGVDLPESARTGVGALALRGLGEGETPLAYGRTPAMELSGLDHATVSVSMLVQRGGSAVRALKLPKSPQRPLLTTVGERYLVIADQSSTSLQVVDLLDLRAHAEEGVTAAPPVTLATSTTKTLIVDDKFGATQIDLDAGTSRKLDPPPGVAFADVARGAVIRGDDGATYVVGPTRGSAEGPASDAVLRLAADGTLSARHLLRARTGASATWVNGRGLVIVGGKSPSGVDTPGVELLATGATVSAPLPYPADTTEGAIVGAIDGATIVRLGADGTVRKYDLGCTIACTPVDLGLRADVVTARPGDVLLPQETGGFVVVRGGRVSILDAALTAFRPVHDAGDRPVQAIMLSTGVTAVVVAGDDVLRTVRGDVR